MGTPSWEGEGEGYRREKSTSDYLSRLLSYFIFPDANHEMDLWVFIPGTAGHIPKDIATLFTSGICISTFFLFGCVQPTEKRRKKPPRFFVDIIKKKKIFTW